MADADGAGTLAAAARFAGAGILGLVAALALGSCGGGGGDALETGTITRSLPTTVSTPARTEPAAPAVTITETEVVTETVTEPGAAVTETVTEPGAAVTETAPTTTQPPATTVTVTETETQTVTEAAQAVTTTVTTTEGVPPAAAAAAGAAVASDEDDGLTSSEWGWIAFGVLAVAVVVGGIAWWLRRRSSAKAQGEDLPPAPNLPA